MLLGPALRSLRLRRGWTQAQVAEITGIPTSVLSAYERGRRVPGADAAARIVGALGYRVDLVELPDPARCARDLEQVLGLAEALPFRPRPLARARR